MTPLYKASVAVLAAFSLQVSVAWAESKEFVIHVGFETDTAKKPAVSNVEVRVSRSGPSSDEVLLEKGPKDNLSVQFTLAAGDSREITGYAPPPTKDCRQNSVSYSSPTGSGKGVSKGEASKARPKAPCKVSGLKAHRVAQMTTEGEFKTLSIHLDKKQSYSKDLRTALLETFAELSRDSGLQKKISAIFSDKTCAEVVKITKDDFKSNDVSAVSSMLEEAQTLSDFLGCK